MDFYKTILKRIMPTIKLATLNGSSEDEPSEVFYRLAQVSSDKKFLTTPLLQQLWYCSVELFETSCGFDFFQSYDIEYVDNGL